MAYQGGAPVTIGGGISTSTNSIAGTIKNPLAVTQYAAGGAVVPAGSSTDPQYVSASSTPSAAANSGLTVQCQDGVSALLLKATAGNLYSVNVVNSTVAGFAIVCNLNAIPASGAAIAPSTKIYEMAVAANTSLRDGLVTPFYGSSGLVMLFSTSATTYTPPGTLPLSMLGAVA